jgi:hypothetical protein
VNPLDLGDGLGDLTNELDLDEWITEYVALAPKSYAYKTSTGKTSCKVKGFCLNHETSNLINFETMKEQIFRQ